MGLFVKNVFDSPTLLGSLNLHLAGAAVSGKDQGHSHRSLPVRVWAKLVVAAIGPDHPAVLSLLHKEGLSLCRHASSTNSVRTAFSRRLLIGTIRRLESATTWPGVNDKLFTFRVNRRLARTGSKPDRRGSARLNLLNRELRHSLRGSPLPA